MFENMYAELLVIVPLVIALTALVIDELADKGIEVGRFGKLGIAGAAGIVLSIGATYFDVFPEPVQVIVAGLAVAWVGSGIVKLADYASPSDSD